MNTPPANWSVDSATTWIRRHPTFAFVAVAFVLFIAATIVVPPAKAASPGHIFVLFGVGSYTAISVVRGFTSVFRHPFSALTVLMKLRVLLLSALLTIPCPGIIAFNVVALIEFLGQMQCQGGGCAQGGILATLFFGVAWICYLLVVGMNKMFLWLHWWPNGIVPDFGGKW
jgi:hypothetical protein